jgi:hypothetical protein
MINKEGEALKKDSWFDSFRFATSCQDCQIKFPLSITSKTNQTTLPRAKGMAVRGYPQRKLQAIELSDARAASWVHLCLHFTMTSLQCYQLHHLADLFALLFHSRQCNTSSESISAISKLEIYQARSPATCSSRRFSVSTVADAISRLRGAGNLLP